MIVVPLAKRLACDVCGGEPFAVSPGSNELREAGIMLQRGEAMRCWCLLHWLAVYRRAA